jgi:DNA modification methylase
MAKSSRRPVCQIAPNLADKAVPLGSISADPANTRVHDERSIEALKGSLRRFGQQKPVVLDEAGVVIAGNGTLEAARQMGWTHIAAVTSDLGGIDRAAYSIADNKIAELSTWNEAALKSTVQELPRDVAEAAGFTAAELDEMFNADLDESVTEDAPLAILPDAVTRIGDLWHLGAHRLLCGDSTKADDVDLLMQGRKAMLIATDPPYLVDYTGVRAGERGKDWSSTYREIEIEDAGGFFHDVFATVVRVAAPHAAIYCWHAMKRITEILEAWRQLGILDHQQIIWVKPAAVFGSVCWHFRHEPCLMGWVQGSKPQHDGQHEHGSVWVAQGNTVPLEQYSKAQLVQALKEACSVWEVDWEGKARPVGNEHPTQKPLELFARPMRKHTRRGDLCFEPFSGSGSQIIAGEQIGRVVHAMEIEPVFVDVAIRRWQTATGKAARLGADGPTWAEVAKERGVEIKPCPASPPTPATKPAAER